MDYLASLTTLPHVSFLNRFAPKGEWTHFRRRNGEFILYYLTGGAMHLREEAEDFALGPGDVLLLHPGLVHEGTKPARCDYYFVHFSNLALLPVPPGEPPAAGYPEEGEAKFDMQRCLLPKLAHIESPEARARLAGYFEEAIAARGGLAKLPDPVGLQAFGDFSRSVQKQRPGGFGRAGRPAAASDAAPAGGADRLPKPPLW